MTSALLYKKNLPNGKFLTYSGKSELPCYQVDQVHSEEVLTLVDPDKKTSTIKADGLAFFYNEKKFRLPPNILIRTADCLPIVILGHLGYAHVHVGWRGLQKGILNQPILSELDPYYAFIGPSIHECCYEVGADFENFFPQSLFFKKKGERYFFNLQAQANLLLKKSFSHIVLEQSGVCTYCSSDFHSFRRNKTSERNSNIYVTNN